jgi:hypothetical protein
MHSSGASRLHGMLCFAWACCFYSCLCAECVCAFCCLLQVLVEAATTACNSDGASRSCACLELSVTPNRRAVVQHGCNAVTDSCSSWPNRQELVCCCLVGLASSPLLWSKWPFVTVVCLADSARAQLVWRTNAHECSFCASEQQIICVQGVQALCGSCSRRQPKPRCRQPIFSSGLIVVNDIACGLGGQSCSGGLD